MQVSHGGSYTHYRISPLILMQHRPLPHTRTKATHACCHIDMHMSHTYLNILDRQWNTVRSHPPSVLLVTDVRVYKNLQTHRKTRSSITARNLHGLGFSSRRLLGAGMDTACWITSGLVFVSPSSVALRPPPQRLKHNTKTKHWRKLWHLKFLQLLISCRHTPDSRENKHSCLSLNVPQMIFVHSLEPQMPISGGLRSQAHMRV